MIHDASDISNLKAFITDVLESKKWLEVSSDEVIEVAVRHTI